MKKKLVWIAIFLVLLPVSIRLISYPWSARLADDFFETSASRFSSMNKGIDYWAEKEMGRENFNTGSSRFDGEWLFGTYLMAAIGKCQYALQFPDKAAALKPEIEKALFVIKSDEVKAFDIEAWKHDPLGLDFNDHGAYLGYFNLALSLYNLTCDRLKLKADTELTHLNREISEYLAARVSLRKNSMIESYPDEYYSVDNCAVIASVDLFDKACKNPRRKITEKWMLDFQTVCIDKVSGTLTQSFDSMGETVDPARASGTFLGIYFLTFMDRKLARQIYDDAKKEYFTTILGYGAVKEHRQGTKITNGDIDSGPVIFNLGVSPIGFMMGCARIFEDEDSFTRLFATCWLGGAPVNSDRWNWKTAGPVGDCILFSMLTGLNNQKWEKL